VDVAHFDEDGVRSQAAVAIGLGEVVVVVALEAFVLGLQEV